MLSYLSIQFLITTFPYRGDKFLQPFLLILFFHIDSLQILSKGVFIQYYLKEYLDKYTYTIIDK